jgi:hypothetical protein
MCDAIKIQSKMKRLSATILLIFISLSCFCQDWKAIFKRELLNSLTSPTDTIFISDRHKLEKIADINCSDKIFKSNTFLKNGDNIEINIEKGDFDPTKHQIHLSDTVPEIVKGRKLYNMLIEKNLIDNRYSYGIAGTMPRTEIKNMSIKWNEINLSISDSAFSNFYEPHLCLDYLPIEVYTSKNEYLYIYISGSDAAGGYSVKFVFSKKKYLTRIVSTNEMTNGYDFIDGTAKYDE